MSEFILENKHYQTLNVLTLGQEACTPGYRYQYAYTHFYLVHYVLRGCGTFTMDGLTRPVSAGHIFIIKPGHAYTYTADLEDPWEYAWFSCNGDLAAVFETVEDILPVEGATILDMLQVDTLPNARMEYLTGKLYEFLSEILAPAPAENNYVRTVADYIKVNYMRHLRVADIAAALNLNSRYLSRLFKTQRGITIQEYILTCRVKQAKSLLAHGMSVAETALLVGYEDPFTFSKMFKRQTGLSPKVYRHNT